MKQLNYEFTKSDVEAILFTLSVLPSLQLEETEEQANMNYHCCLSAGQKLINKSTDFTLNEFRVIFVSLQAAQFINRGELEVDAEVKKQCGNHLFVINKLTSVFGEFFHK